MRGGEREREIMMVKNVRGGGEKKKRCCYRSTSNEERK